MLEKYGRKLWSKIMSKQYSMSKKYVVVEKMLGKDVWMIVFNKLVLQILGKALRSRGWKFYSIYVDNIFLKGEILYSTNVDHNLSKFKVGEFEIEDESA